jgi:hypothetical protein
LPCIELGEALRATVDKDGGDWYKYTTDTVHPRDNGHALYAEVLQNRLTELFGGAAAIDAPMPKVLPARLFPVEESFENAHMVDASEATLGDGWSKVEQSLCGRYPQYIEASEAGAELTFTFVGKRIGLYYMIAPDSGNIEYRIDDKAPCTLCTWDEYAPKFSRAFHSELDTELDYGEHTLRIKVAADKAAESTGTVVRIGTFAVG